MITLSVITGVLALYLFVGGAANLAAIPASICVGLLMIRWLP